MNAKRYLLFILLFVSATISAFGFLYQRNASVGKPITISGVTVPSLPELNRSQVTSGESVYVQNCAGCHGANLEGQPNWKESQSDGKLLPPPQDSSGHTWHHPDDLLISIIENGGDPSYSTMPPFENVLSKAEIQAVLTFIKGSWGQDEREFQWWVTMRDQ